MRVTTQVKEATEKAIRVAARKLFVRKGLEAASTRQIARDAGIAIGTLFNYFPSKEALAMSIAADAFGAGRKQSAARLAADERPASRRDALEEELFTLVACDLRALEPIRAFIGDVLEAGLAPFAAGAEATEGAAIRATRLEDAAAALARHGLADAATGAVMHLYWSLYLGVLSHWAVDTSPTQEDSWALLDQGIRMFTGALRRSSGTEAGGSTRSTISAGPSGAREVKP